MYEYLQINVLLFVLCFIAIALLKSAPSRIKFYITVFSLGVWFVPWQTIEVQLPYEIAKPIHQLKYTHLGNRLNESRGNGSTADHAMATFVATQQLASKNGNPLPLAQQTQSLTKKSEPLLVGIQWLFAVALALGAGIFANKIRGYHRSMKALARHADDANELKKIYTFIPKHAHVCRIDSQEFGMVSGLSRPTLWINHTLQEPQLLKAVLTHESMHIYQHDHLWNWYIALCKSLFWWNPCVLIACRQAKAFIELSCDEKSEKLNGNDGRYTHALLRLIVMQQSVQPNPHVVSALGISRSLILTRIESLQHPKLFKTSYMFYLCVIACASLVLSLGLAQDTIFRQWILNKAQVENQIDEFALQQNFEVYQDERAYFDLAQNIYARNFELANEQIYTLKTKLFSSSVAEDEKLLALRLLAMYYSEIGAWDEIVQLIGELYSEQERTSNLMLCRMLAIAHIRQGQFQAAIDLIETREHLTGYFAPPNIILKAQAYYLQGNYDQTLALLAPLEHYPNRLLYDAFQSTIWRLYGKAGLMAHDEVAVDKALKILDLTSTDTFEQVVADGQSIPHVYFLRSTLNGLRIYGFDTSAFPLPLLTSQAEHLDTENMLAEAIRLANEEQTLLALHTLRQYLQQSENKLSTFDKTRVLEHIFLLQISLGDKADATVTAQALSTLPMIHKPVLARALWLLSIGAKSERAQNIDYFERYLALFNQPSITADHETLKRHYWISDLSLLESALTRVERFYHDNDAVPDLKVINRMIGVYKMLGNKQKMDELYRLVARHYPRATNFIFEPQRHE